jgi:hypothetical protein
MASTPQPSRAERVASNARRWAGGGCIFADARNAVTSAAVILHQTSTHRNTMPRRVTPSSRASSRASTGFTTIVLERCSPARDFTPLTRIRRINRCPDRPKRCLQTGKRCFTNRGGCVVLMSAVGPTWPRRLRVALSVCSGGAAIRLCRRHSSCGSSRLSRRVLHLTCPASRARCARASPASRCHRRRTRRARRSAHW